MCPFCLSQELIPKGILDANLHLNITFWEIELEPGSWDPSLRDLSDCIACLNLPGRGQLSVFSPHSAPLVLRWGGLHRSGNDQDIDRTQTMNTERQNEALVLSLELSEQQEDTAAKFREDLPLHQPPADPAGWSCRNTSKAAAQALTPEAPSRLLGSPTSEARPNSLTPLHGSNSASRPNQQVALNMPHIVRNLISIPGLWLHGTESSCSGMNYPLPADVFKGC